MSVIIGSARIDERGKITGGAAGDQKQTSTPDYKGEVSMQSFYVHSKGWYVIRAKSITHADGIAENMIYACNDPTTGYNQNARLEIVNYGIKSKKKKNCDCSSLVRECVKEATGKDPGNFITDNAKTFLEKTGLFDPAVAYVAGMVLYAGDILVTKTRGHIVIVCYSDHKRSGATTQNTGTVSSSKPSIEQVASDVINGKYGNGDARVAALKKLGFSDAEVKQIQARVNQKLSGSSGSAYYGKYTGSSAMIDEVFLAIGVPAGYRGNWKKRKPIAKANGYLSYTGKATENLALIELAKRGKLIKI